MTGHKGEALTFRPVYSFQPRLLIQCFRSISHASDFVSRPEAKQYLQDIVCQEIEQEILAKHDPKIGAAEKRLRFSLGLSTFHNESIEMLWIEHDMAICTMYLEMASAFFWAGVTFGQQCRGPEPTLPFVVNLQDQGCVVLGELM